MQLKIHREKPSSYFEPTFLQDEKEQLLALGLQWTENLAEADIFISNTHSKTQKLVEEAPNLKLVIHPNSGFDNYSIKTVSKIRCPIILGNSIRASAVADWVLRCLLQSCTPIPFVQTWDKARRWERNLIEGNKILILGLGHVGSILRNLLSPIYGSIQCYDPYLSFNSLPDWKNAHCLIIACALTETSKNLINKQVLKQLPKNFTLINPARGEVLNLEDLKTELNDRQQRGERCQAFLDVYPQEPYDLSQLLSYENVHTSCHIAGVDAQLGKRTIDFEKQVLMDYLKLEFNDFEARWRHLNLKVRPQYEFVGRSEEL